MFGVIGLSERSYEVIIPRLDRILEVSCDAYTPHTHAQTYTHMLTVGARGKKPTQTLKASVFCLRALVTIFFGRHLLSLTWSLAAIERCFLAFSITAGDI